MRSLILALAALPLLASQASPQAGQRSPIRQACLKDTMAHCREFVPLRPQVRACLNRKKSVISAGCRKALADNP